MISLKKCLSAGETDSNFPQLEKQLLDNSDSVRDVKYDFETKVKCFQHRLAGENWTVSRTAYCRIKLLTLYAEPVRAAEVENTNSRGLMETF